MPLPAIEAVDVYPTGLARTTKYVRLVPSDNGPKLQSPVADVVMVEPTCVSPPSKTPALAPVLLSVEVQLAVAPASADAQSSTPIVFRSSRTVPMPGTTTVVVTLLRLLRGLTSFSALRIRASLLNVVPLSSHEPTMTW